LSLFSFAIVFALFKNSSTVTSNFEAFASLTALSSVSAVFGP
jgi:hypothetical protein